jgi:hypothetical protein
MSKLPLALFLLACGQPRAPSQEDACRDDSGCSAGLVCCHTTGETAPSSAGFDRGFCVKAAVCSSVAVPAQPALPPTDD